jgi:hypothetical protein
MRRFLSICFCLYLLCNIGCQRLPERPEGMPELVPCVVVVTFGGEKIEGVRVLFHPKHAEENTWSAGGQTDAEGRAVMTTAVYYRGVVPGEYTVSFQKSAPDEMRPDGMPLPGRPLIPLKYSPNRSTETIVVSKSQTEYVFILDAL